jgi:hypothetical protein
VFLPSAREADRLASTSGPAGLSAPARSQTCFGPVHSPGLAVSARLCGIPILAPTPIAQRRGAGCDAAWHCALRPLRSTIRGERSTSRRVRVTGWTGAVQWLALRPNPARTAVAALPPAHQHSAWRHHLSLHPPRPRNCRLPPFSLVPPRQPVHDGGRPLDCSQSVRLTGVRGDHAPHCTHGGGVRHRQSCSERFQVCVPRF